MIVEFSHDESWSQVFMDKTKNSWDSRHDFQAVEGKYTLIDVEGAAACLASKDIVYRKGFLEELGFPQDNIPVYCDNAATVLFSASTKITSLNKHILIRGAYTRDLQKQGVITLIFCPGKLNLADQQTKNLYGETFYGFLPMYGFVMISSYP